MFAWAELRKIHTWPEKAGFTAGLQSAAVWSAVLWHRSTEKTAHK